MSDIKDIIREFLLQYFKKHELAYDQDIYSLGFVNSMFAVQLVIFLENEFQISLDNKDINFNDFRTINSMYSLIQRKKGNVFQSS